MLFIFRIIGDSFDTNIILIRLEDSDKHKCDFIISEFNRKNVNFEENEKREDMLIKKIELNCSYEKILMKIQNINLEELFFEKNNKTQNLVPPPPIKEAKQKNDIRAEVNNSNNENLALEIEKLNQERNCVICMDNLKNILFLPCSHIGKLCFSSQFKIFIFFNNFKVSCVECSVSVQSCPICRKNVEMTLRTFS